MNLEDKNSFEFPSATLAVFAREPHPGQVKTRMHPRLGVAGALALHEQLIRYVAGNLQEAKLCPLELWTASANPSEKVDEKHHDLFLSICNAENIHNQCGEDLGRRMQHAARAVLERAQYVVLVGADCPSVDEAYLRDALTHLRNGIPIVIGPAEDGGYVLLGLREAPAYLFSDIAWGSDSVMEATRDRLRHHDAQWIELAPRWDVDRPEDLERLASLSPPFLIPPHGA